MCATSAEGGIDVEDRSQLQLAVSEMEVWPSGAALQGEALHKRASAWCARQGLREEAVEHAVSGREWETAAELIEAWQPPQAASVKSRGGERCGCRRTNTCVGYERRRRTRVNH